ncbi:MAG: chemotaxis protein CheD [Gammaproteobacteria bacterium]|nr:chemotaxis protein CheD [Gammaproteobacteria bacterium]
MSDIFLKPGDWYFGRYQQGLAHTILGSCVSLVLHSSEHRLVAISHALLPAAPIPQQALNGRFVTDVLTLFAQHARRFSVNLSDFDAVLVGGGDMFAYTGNGMSIGQKNIQKYEQLLQFQRVIVKQQYTGGRQYRKLTVDLSDASLQVQSSPVNNFELVPA